MISLAEGDEGTVQRIFPSRLWQQKWCFPARFQVDAGDGLVDATVCCPWKLAPPSSSPLPSLGRKLLCEAHASISVPSTEKCSSDNSGLTCGWLRSLVMKLVNTSPFCSRSRF